MAATASSSSTHQWLMTTMRQKAALIIVLMLGSLVISTIPGAFAMPVQINIPFRGKECLYDFMEQGYVYHNVYGGVFNGTFFCDVSR
jgi:hypothetical protein